ncbi:uncharacterized protein L199_008582 [Kwoniella botswanensis]|uniref:uncharacterized protein n=1 Tax=Kwoniella botswanensis TaxID=1268659 RepID=UPI00315C7418
MEVRPPTAAQMIPPAGHPSDLHRLQYVTASGLTSYIGNAEFKLLDALQSIKKSGPYTADDIQSAFNKMNGHGPQTTSTAAGSDSKGSEGPLWID